MIESNNFDRTRVRSYYGQHHSGRFIFDEKITYACDYIEMFSSTDPLSQRNIILFLNEMIDRTIGDLAGIIFFPGKETVKNGLDKVFVSISKIKEGDLNEEQKKKFCDISRRISAINNVLSENFENELLILLYLNRIKNEG